MSFQESSYGLDIMVDLNGNKPPNQFGKDVFDYTIQNGDDKLQFFVYNERTRENIIDSDCQPGGWGIMCGALIMLDGWEIKDDYPW